MEDPNTNTGIRGQEWLCAAAGAALVGVAFLLRIYRIGQEELWFDEAFSFYVATFASWPEVLLRDNTPPLYYLLLTAWIHVAGQSESAIRLLSAVSGTLFVAAMIWLGRQIIGHSAALWSGAVSALAPIQIYYSQEARAYALVTLLLALCYGALWRALQTNGIFWWAATSICALLALYSHYFALLALIPTALLVWLWPKRKEDKRKWLRYAMSISVSVLLFVPWILWSLHVRPYSLTGIGWIQETWQQTPPLLAIPKSLEVFTLGSQADFISIINVKRFGALLMPEWLRLGGLAALALLGIWVAIPGMETQLAVPWLKKRKVWLWTLLFFPLGTLWVISFYQPVYAVGRYEIIAFPAYALLLGLALAKVQRVPKAGPLLTFIVAFYFFLPIGVKLGLYYNAPSRQLARPTAAAIDRLVKDGDVVVLTSLRANTTIYYLTRLGFQWKEGLCQNESAGRHFSCRVYSTQAAPVTPADPSIRMRAGDVSREALQEVIRDLRPHENTLWVVLYPRVSDKGRLEFPPADSFLIEEIMRLGLKPVAVRHAPGLVYFR
jgi:mannosyltransferase